MPSLLIDAIGRGDFERAKKRIEAQGIQILFLQGANNRTPIDHIAIDGAIELFDYIWQNPANRESIIKYRNREFSLATLAIAANSEEFLKHLLTTLPIEELRQLFASEGLATLPLHRAIIKNMESVAKLMMAKGLNCTDKDHLGFSPVQLAILVGGYDDFLVKNGFVKSAKEVDDTTRVANACAFLAQAYSQEGFYMRTDLVLYFYRNLLHRNLEESDKKFMTALEIINGRELTEINPEQRFKVIPIVYSNHVAFMIMLYDENDLQKQILYCDGYNQFNTNPSTKFHNLVHCFAIKPEFQNFRSLEYEIIDIFDGQGPEIYANTRNLAQLFAKFVVCDGKDYPIISKSYIPAQEQDSSSKLNCAFKSTNIAMREIALLMHPEMTYELSAEGKPCGTLYDDYKRFKHKAIDAAIAILEETLTQPDQNIDNVSLVRRCCESALVKSEKKMEKTAKEGNFAKADFARFKKLTALTVLEPSSAPSSGEQHGSTKSLLTHEASLTQQNS